MKGITTIPVILQMRNESPLRDKSFLHYEYVFLSMTFLSMLQSRYLHVIYFTVLYFVFIMFNSLVPNIGLCIFVGLKFAYQNDQSFNLFNSLNIASTMV